MSSELITRGSSSEEPHISLPEIASIFYDEESRPFKYGGLSFDQLPQVTRTFLRENTEQLPPNLLKEECDQYFRMLLAFREAQQERLARTLEGVHRAIVTKMLIAKADHSNHEVLDTLREVLVPEWRSHLDDYVEHIDALIWFEMEMRKNTPYDMLPQEFLRERREDVQRMIEFALQSLQTVNESVKREMGGNMFLEGGVDVEDSDGGSSVASSDEFEESLFSDTDNDPSSSSESESQWITVDRIFNRVVS